MIVSREQCVAIARLVLEHSGRPFTEQRVVELAEYLDQLGPMPDLSAEQRSRLAVLLRPPAPVQEAA